jgi:hypothetical protein
MHSLPHASIKVLLPFSAAFRPRTWRHALPLLIGAILCPAQRTVAAALRILGRHHDPHFQTAHRILSRATWSSRRCSHILLMLLLRAFVPDHHPLILGIDETIERRRGSKIAARGIYRDPVRSSREHMVKTGGLRWVSLHLLATVPFIGRVWALPFLTVLAPSERYAHTRGIRYKSVPDWGRQMLRQVRRWLPHRRIVVVADSTYAAFRLMCMCQQLATPLTLITRLRLDAALYDPAPARTAQTRGRRRVKGKRQAALHAQVADPKTRWKRAEVNWYGGRRRVVEFQSGTAVRYTPGKAVVPIRWVVIRDVWGRFETQALMCTDMEMEPVQMVEWFVMRWQVEVTFHEGRTHLGLETQRQWSERAIARTTPVLLGLYSVVTLMAHEQLKGRVVPVRQAAWYQKSQATFGDTLAYVRGSLWQSLFFCRSADSEDLIEIPRGAFLHMAETLAYAA